VRFFKVEDFFGLKNALGYLWRCKFYDAGFVARDRRICSCICMIISYPVMQTRAIYMYERTLSPLIILPAHLSLTLTEGDQMSF
jgi:hypothetical protein